MDDEDVERLKEILENNRNCGAIEHNEEYDGDDFGEDDEDD